MRNNGPRTRADQRFSFDHESVTALLPSALEHAPRPSAIGLNARCRDHPAACFFIITRDGCHLFNRAATASRICAEFKTPYGLMTFTTIEHRHKGPEHETASYVTLLNMSAMATSWPVRH